MAPRRRREPNRSPSAEYRFWEKSKDIVDNLIDVVLNYRQSGHPGGSRSKVPAFLVLLLGGAMRWDIRAPEARFADRFILSAGHTVPLVYCTLAVLNEAMRLKFAQTGDERYRLPPPERTLIWEDLLLFRRRGGLSGHAEMKGKTLFLKFNTGPSGHGIAAAIGEALALKRAGAGEVKVFAMEGEGGLTPGANHEAMNSAWGLALDNLVVLVDWNDYGIDEHRVSDVVYGTPRDWFEGHGWHVSGTEKGSSWESLALVLAGIRAPTRPSSAPTMVWFKTRKGRGYLKYDSASHGAPHEMNCELFWETKRVFSEKYGVSFRGTEDRTAQNEEDIQREFRENTESIIEVLRRDQELVDYLADRLVEIAELVPQATPSFELSDSRNPFADERLYDFRHYPSELFAAPGVRIANRAALAKWGAWVNALGRREYDRPLILAASADLAESTNIAGFAKGHGSTPGYGWYERFGLPSGVLLPQGITEFVNAGIMTGVASLNFSKDPYSEFQGFWGTCSTYGSFSYLKYGMFRLFSQLAQDCDFKVGKVIWVVGHSGPETADDSRTHFGIFSPGVTQLFPEGQIINLHPWEHNEVPVLLGAALAVDVPIVALHLTRPPIEVPNRSHLGLPAHFEAARGAYVIRDYLPDEPRGGTIIIQGTSAMSNVLEILPTLEARRLNVKLVYAASHELFTRQPASYRESTLSPSDCLDSTVITSQARILATDWLFNCIAKEYAMSSDWDNRWRTGGTLSEVLDEAHISGDWLLTGIERFVNEKEVRLDRLQRAIKDAERLPEPSPK